MADAETGGEGEGGNAPVSGRGVVTAKAGKLPVWAWVGLASAGVFVAIILLKGKGNTQPAAAPALPPAVGMVGSTGTGNTPDISIGGFPPAPSPTPTPTTSNPYPALNLTEGSLYRVAGQQAVYQYQGGQLNWLTAPMFAALGNPWGQVNELPEWATQSPSWILNPSQPASNPGNGQPIPGGIYTPAGNTGSIPRIPIYTPLPVGG